MSLQNIIDELKAVEKERDKLLEKLARIHKQNIELHKELEAEKLKHDVFCKICRGVDDD